MNTSDIILNLRVQSDYTQAIEDAKTFKQEMKDTETYAANIGKALDFIQSDEGQEKFKDMFGENFQTLDEVRSIITDINTELADVREGFKGKLIDDSFAGTAANRLKGIQQALHSVGREMSTIIEGKGSIETIERMFNSVRNADVSRRDLSLGRSIYGSASQQDHILSFLSKQDMSNIGKAQGHINKEINRINASSKGTLPIEVLSSQLMQSPMFTKAMEAVSANRTEELTRDQIESIAKLMVYRSNKFSTSHYRDAEKRLNIIGSKVPLFVAEQIPAEMRKAFQTYGDAGATKRMKDTTLLQEVDPAAMAAFRKLVRKGNRAAIDVGIQSGLLSMDNGNISFGRGTVGKWSAMAGLAARRAYEAKAGVPFMWADPNDPNEQERLLKRQSKRFVETDDLMKAIALQKVYKADAEVDQKYLTFEHDAKQKAAKLQKGWYPDQYFIPQTRINAKTGELEVSDPKKQIEWHKGYNPFEKKASDEFVSMGSNSVTQLLGLTGNNTFGYGRDNKGTPIYKTPLIVKLNTEGAYTENADREYVVETKEKGKEEEDKIRKKLNDRHIKIADRKERPVYNGQEYVYGWGDSEGQVLINADVYDTVFGRKALPKVGTKAYKELEERLTKPDENGNSTFLTKQHFESLYAKGKTLRDKGLSSILDNLTAEDFLEDDAAAQQKAIEAGRKKATPGFNYKEFGFKELPKMALVDFGTMYDKMGVAPTDSFMRIQKRIDGVSYIDPKLAPSGYGFQARAGFGGMKFFAQPEDWRKELQQGRILETAYNTLDANGNGVMRYLFDRKDNPNKPVLKQKAENAKDEYVKTQAEVDRIKGEIDINTDNTILEQLRTELKTAARSRNKARATYKRANHDYEQELDYLYDFYMPQVGLDKIAAKNLDEEGVKNVKGSAADWLFRNLEKEQKTIDTNKDQNAVALATKRRNYLRDKYMHNIMDADIGLLVSDSSVKFAHKYMEMEEEDFHKLFDKKDASGKVVEEAKGLGFKGRGKDRKVLLNAQQQSGLAQAITDIVGLQVNRMSPDFEAVKDFIPASLAVALGADQELVKESDKNYKAVIDELSRPEGAMGYLRSLPQARGKSNEWFTSDEAKALVQNRINQFEYAKAQHHLFFPDSVGMAASGVKPGAGALSMFAGSKFNLDPANLPDSDYKELLSEALSEESIFAASRRFKDDKWQELGASRMPASPAENLGHLSNKGRSSAFRRALRAVGADENLIYLSPHQQYQLNSGDFDGDTTWIFQDYTGGVFDKINYNRTKLANARLKLREMGADKSVATEGIKATSRGQALTQFQLNHRNAQNEMALYSGGIRNAMLGWDDTDEKWLAIAMDIDAYDKATSERMKQGTKVNAGPIGMKAAKEGAAFERLVKQMVELSNEKEGASANLFGTKISSMRDLEDIASIYAVFDARRKGELPNEGLADELKRWTAENYDESTSKGMAAKRYAEVLSNHVTGRKLADRHDIGDLYYWAGKWQNDIERQKKAGVDTEELKNEEAEVRRFIARLGYMQKNGMTQENVANQIDVLNREKKRYESLQTEWNNSKTKTISKSAFMEFFGDKINPQRITNNGRYVLTDKQAKEYGTILPAKIFQREQTIKAYKGLLEPADPFVAYLDSIKDQFDEEEKAAVEQIRKQHQESLKNGERAAGDMTREDLRAMLKTETVARRTKMNWSDVTPWMYEAMQGSDFKLKGIQYKNLMGKKHLGYEEPHELEAGFDPYPYRGNSSEREDREKKEEQKALIQARELDNKGHFVKGYEETPATLGGSLRHKAFELFFKSRTLGKNAISPRDMLLTTDDDKEINVGLSEKQIYKSQSPEELLYNMLLGSGTQKKLADWGIGVKKLESGALAFNVQDVHAKGAEALRESLAQALGNWDNKTKTYKGGTLSAFVKALRNEEIANIEGFNVINGKIVNEEEKYGRGVKIKHGERTEYTTDDQGKLVPKGKEDVIGSFAPDLITRNKQTGKFTMYDYKTGKAGAIDSLYQQYVYLADILEKTKEEDAEKYGWKQFLDKKGNLNFEGLKAFDTTTGGLYSLKFNKADMEAIKAFYDQGKEIKQGEAESGFEKGRQYIENLVAKQYGQHWKELPKHNAESIMSRIAPEGSNAAFDYLSHKFGQDEETIQSISSSLYREYLKQNNISGGGFNRFDKFRKQLDETLDPDMMDKLTEKFKASGDDLGLEYLEKIRKQKEEERQNIDKYEKMAAVTDWDTVNARMRENMFGAKADSSISTIFDTVQAINSARKLREGWKLNSDLWDVDKGTWTKEGRKQETDFFGNVISGSSYAERYAQAEKKEKETLKLFSESLPILSQNTINETNDTLANLISSKKDKSPEEVIQKAYQDRINALSKFISNQEATITEAENALVQMDQGEKVLKEGSPEEQAMQAVLENAKASRKEALKAIASGQIQKSVIEDQKEKLGMVRRNPKKEAENWLNARTAIIRQDAIEEYNKLDADLARREANAERNWMSPTGTEADKETYDQIRAERKAALIATKKKIKQGRKDYSLIADQIEKEGYLDIRDSERQASMMFGGLDTRTSKEKAEDEVIRRLNRIRQSMSAPQFAEYLKQNSFDDLVSQTEKEINESIDLQWLAKQQQEDRLQHQNEMAAEQRRHQSEQMRRNRFGGSRSRIGNVYRQQLDQKWSLDQQVKNNKFYAKQAEESIKLQKDAFETKYKMSYADYQKLTPEAQKAMGGEAIVDAGKISSAQQQMEGYANAARDAAAQSEQMTGASMAMSATFQGLSQSLSMVAHRLGRQLFMKTLQETKRFIKEFDASMNEIQAITLKSDQEMQGVRSQTIGKAIGLRTSVSNVSNVEAALYRQGLSDQEVSSRTDSIIKFATVTKLNVAEATKIITTALQNDLVESATAAMDALVALGDSAATTAAEIGKGMQKAAASAKVAGVSYEELTALLTIGTSDTQLSGTQVGTALQTVFTRMRRLSLTGYTADQNGEKTSASDAEAALRSVGVDLWDDKSVGKMRSAYEVMLDLSRVWQNLSDAQKSIVTNSLAGTRQTNVFSTLMEGMAEDGGATLEKYLGLAEGSEGITQSKYEIAMQSLSAAMDEVKSSWDSVVESFVTGGSLTGVLDSFSGFLQLIANGSPISNGFGVIVGGIAAITTACLAAKTAIAPIGTIISLIAGLAVGGGIAAIGGAIGGLFKQKTFEEQKDSDYNKIVKNGAGATLASNLEGKKEVINEVKELGKAYDELSKSGTKLQQEAAGQALVDGLNNLKDAFPGISDEVQKAIEKLTGWSDAVKEAEKETSKYTKNAALQSALDVAELHATRGNLDYEHFISTQMPDDLIKFGDYFTTIGSYGTLNDDRYSDTFNNAAAYLASATVDKKDKARAMFQALRELKRSGNDSLLESVKSYLSSHNGQGLVEKALDEQYIWNDNENDEQHAIWGEAAESLAKGWAEEMNTPEDMKELRKRIYDEEFIDTILDDYEAAGIFASLENDNYSKEEIRKNIKRRLLKNISDNKDKYIPDGDIITSEIDSDIFGIIKDSEEIEEVIESEKNRNDYAYYVDDKQNKDKFYGFKTYDEAIDFLQRHKTYNTSDLFTGSGLQGFQSTRQLLNASVGTQNINNKNDVTNSILYGFNRALTEEEENIALAKYIAGTNNEEYGRIITAINQGDTSFDEIRKSEAFKAFRSALPEYKATKPLTKYLNEDNPFEALFTDAENGLVNTELANYIANTPDVLAAVLGNDFNAFISAVQNNEPGKSTPLSQSDKYRNIMNMLITNPEYIDRFRNDAATQEAYKNFQSFFGDNADMMLESMLAGTFEGSELQEQANKILAEKGIMPGVGKQFTGVQTANMAKQVFGIGNWTQAQQELKWTTDKWSAIANKYPDLQRYLEMDEYQKASQEGQNLRRNLEIQFNVAGISDLEEAGIVLDGLTEKLTNLQKGGEFAIKARLDIENEGYQINQLGAQLNSSNRREQIEAIQQLTGRSATQIQNDFTGSLEQAQLMQQYNMRKLARTAEAEWEFMSPEDQKAQDDLMASFGFRAESNYDDRGFELNGTRRYVYTGKTSKQDREDLLYGAERRYSATDIARARQRILEGTLTHETEGKYDLYSAAVNELGFYGREYDRLKRENVTGKQLEDARRLAEAENAEALRIAQEQQTLEDAKLLSGTSIAATNNYAQLQYNQQNKAGLAANRLYEAISGEGIKSFEDFNELLAGEGLQDWKELIESAGPELTKRFKDLGISIGPNGLDISSIENAGGDVAAALEQVAQIIAEQSVDFSEYKPVETTQDQINKATAFINGTDQSKEAIEAYSSLVGDSDLTQIRANAYKQYDIYAENFAQEQRSYGVPENYIQEDINMMRPGRIQNYVQSQLSNNLDRRYQTAVERNAMLGIQGLTDIDKYEGLMDIVNAIRSGASLSGENGIRTGARTQAYKAFTSSVEGADNWLSATEILQQNGTSWENLTEDEYNKLPDAFKDIYGSYDKAIEANTNFEEGVEKLNASLKISSDYLDDYNTGLDKNSKNAKTAANAQVKYNQAISSIKTSQYYRQQYRKGSRSGEVLDQIASMTGKQKSDVGKKDNQKEIEEQLKEQEQQQLDQLNTMLAGEQEEWTDEINEFISSHPIDIEAEGIQVNVDTGTITVSSDYEHLADMVGADVAAQMQAYVAQLNGQGFDSEIQLFQDGSGAWHGRVVATTLGEGSKGGGGGGGGGKSKTDELLEKQKHTMAGIEHELKMNEAAEKDASRTYDTETYNQLIERRIELLTKQKEQYAANIAEMEALLKKTKAGTDDYKKLEEAIWAAQEAMAAFAGSISEANKARIDMIQQRQEKDDNVQKRDIDEASAEKSYAQLVEDYDTYRTKLADIVANKNISLLQNATQRAELEEELSVVIAKEGYDSQNAEDLRNKISGINVEDYGYQQEIVELLRELNETERSILQADIERKTEIDAAYSEMLQSGASLAQSTENRSLYRSYLREDNAAIENELKVRSEANAGLFARISGEAGAKLKATAPEDYSRALEDWKNNILAIDQLTSQINDNNYNIDMSYVEEITQSFEDATRAATAYADISRTLADIYRTDENFEGYRAMLAQSIDLNYKLRDAAIEEEAALKAQLATINRSVDPKAYRETEEALLRVSQEVVNYTKTIQDNTIAIEKNYAEQIKLNAARAAIAPNTMNSVLSSYGDMYKRNGQWDDYRETLDRKIDNVSILQKIDQESAAELYARLTGTKGDYAETRTPIEAKIKQLEDKKAEDVKKIDNRIATLENVRNTDNNLISEYDKKIESKRLEVATARANEKRVRESTQPLSSESEPSGKDTAKVGIGTAAKAEKNPELVAAEKWTQEAEKELHALKSEKNGLESRNKGIDAEIAALGSEKDATISAADQAIKDAEEKLKESFYSETESWVEAYEQWAELVKDDAAKQKEMFDTISERQDVARQRALYNINEQNRTPSGIIDLASIYAANYGLTHNWAGQQEAYQESQAQRKTKIANLRQQADELYQDIISHNDNNPWISEEVKDKAIKTYQDILKQVETEVGNEIKDRIAEATSKHNEQTEKNADARRTIDFRTQLSQIRGEAYLSDEDFSAYRGMLAENNSALRDSIDQRRKHIEELESELDLYKDSPDLLRQVTDEINNEQLAIEKETKALKDNTAAAEANRLAQLQLYNTRANLAAQTNASLASTYAQTAQSNGDYEGYRRNTKLKMANNKSIIYNNEATIGALQRMIEEGLFENEQQRQSAIEKMYSLITTNANLNASMTTDERSIKNSYIEEISRGLDINLLQPNYLNDVYGAWASRYSSIGNYEGQRNALVQQLGISQTMASEYEKAAKAIRFQRAGMEKNSPEWYEATQKLIECETAIQKLKITAEETAEEIQKSIIDGILKTYEDNTRGTQHNIDKADIYADMYNSTQYYDKYQNMLQTQIDDRATIRAELESSIATLEDRLESTRGTGQYDRVVNELYSRKNELAKLEQSDIKNEIEIANSKVNAELKSRQKNIDAYDRQIKVASMEASYYADNKNVEKYTEAINKQSDAIKQKQEYEKNELNTLMALAKTIPENTDAYEKIEKQIYDSAMAVAEMDIELIKLNKQIKSMELDELFERMSRIDEMQNHKKGIASTVTSRYQNTDELTNVNYMLQHQNDITAERSATLKEFISQLEAELPTLDKGSDEYWKVASSIMKYEEELEEATNTIEANNKAIKENNKRILENRKSLEDLVEAEIEQRIQEERDMLQGTTSIQDQLLGIIRENYSKEWDLIRKDIEKKKEALNQEKALISERLNARKNAMNTEEKYRELEELQRQLALVSTDSTRTKDAKELRKKIEELQRNLSMEKAEQEATAAQEAIDQQLQAMDEDINNKQENLNEYLEDANNFKEIIDTLINGSFEDLTAWIKANDENYKNSLDAQREELLMNWEDTWKQMRGIVDTYFNQINEIISSSESLLEYMRDSSAYKNASEAYKKILEDEWAEAFRLVVAGETSSDEAKNWNHSDQYDIARQSQNLDDLAIDMSAGVQGGEKITPTDYVKDKEYRPNTYPHDEPYLGQNDSELWSEAVKQYQEANTAALEAFIAAASGAMESDEWKALQGIAGKLEEDIKTRDDLKAEIDELDKTTDNYATKIEALKELNSTIADETAKKEVLNQEFNDWLTAETSEAFENANSALNLMQEIATDNLNDLDKVIGENGAKEFENTLEAIQTNKNNLNNFIDDKVGPELKENILALYNNATEGYNRQEKTLTDMANSVDGSTSETAASIQNTSEKSAKEFKETSDNLVEDFGAAAAAAEAQQVEDAKDALEAEKLVNDYYQNLDEQRKQKFDETMGQFNKDVSNITSKETELINAIGGEDGKTGGLVGEIGKMTSGIAALWGAEGTATTEISNLTDALDGGNGLTKKLETLNTKLGNLSDSIGGDNGEGGLNSKLGNLTSSLGTTNDDLNNLTSSLGTTNTDLNNLTTALGETGLKGTLTTYSTSIQSWLSDSKKRLEQVEEDSQKYKKKIEEIANKSNEDDLTKYIKNLYRQYLGREADAAGLASWYAVGDKNKILEGILSSAEYKQLHPEDNTTVSAPITEQPAQSKPTTQSKPKYWTISGYGEHFNTEAEAQERLASLKKASIAKWGNASVTPHYKHGGLADYTGLAWVDGTKLRPEAFLNPEQTELIGQLAQSLRYVSVMPHMSVPGNMIGNNTTVGDINITINQAELKSDADYEDVARNL